MFSLVGRFKREVSRQGCREAFQAGGVGQGGADYRYNPELVEYLAEDHLRILGAIEEVELLLHKERLGLIGRSLQELNDLVKAHQVKEDVRLFKYLERRLQGEPLLLEKLRLARVEREQFNQRFGAFFRRYHALATQPFLKAQFRADLGLLGDALVSQFEHEECELYALYLGVC
jgi:hypothetical protein